MNANFNKLICSAAILALGSSAFAKTKAVSPAPSFEQGYGVSTEQFPAAYNASARVNVQDGWNVFMTSSFTYWYADQDGMDLAIQAAVDTSYPTFLMQKFSFKPGFKLGLGMNFGFDNWVGFVEYTWFRSKVTRPTKVAGHYWYISDWFKPGGLVSSDLRVGDNLYDPSVTGVGAGWRLNIDIADVSMSRPFYQGRSFTILPFGGLRSAFIRQNIRVKATINSKDAYYSHNHSNSWAIGPRVGLQSHWLFGWGCRLEGDVSSSLLFTRYTKIAHFEDGDRLYCRYADYNTMRPMADLNLGFGWGSYFDDQKYHWDLLVTYDFNVMWGQNMIRSMLGTYDTNSRHAWAPGDLHLQGLTFTSRFDF